MQNKAHISVFAWRRAVKLSPSSGGWWMSDHIGRLSMARTVGNGVLIPGVGISAEPDSDWDLWSDSASWRAWVAL